MALGGLIGVLGKAIGGKAVGGLLGGSKLAASGGGSKLAASGGGGGGGGGRARANIPELQALPMAQGNAAGQGLLGMPPPGPFKSSTTLDGRGIMAELMKRGY